MAELWIYSFRKSGKRELTDDEKAALGRLARRKSGVRFAWGAVAVLLALIAILGIILAADARPWGWGLFLASTIAFFYAIHFANNAEKLNLLYRRSARVGVVDEYVRTERTEHVRAQYIREVMEEESSQPSCYWQADERFEDRLLKTCGKRADWLETPADDDVVITVGGQTCREIIDVPILRV